jgi:hypothetical protein
MSPATDLPGAREGGAAQGRRRVAVAEHGCLQAIDKGLITRHHSLI